MSTSEPRAVAPLSLSTLAATRIVFAVERVIEWAATRRSRRVQATLDARFLKDIGLD